MKKLLFLIFVNTLGLYIGKAQNFDKIKFVRQGDPYKSFSTVDYNRQYLQIKGANIEADLKSALTLKDSCFIALQGNSYLYCGLEGGYIYNKKRGKTFIGLSKRYHPLLKRFKFKIIEGTGDDIDMTLPPLQSVAYDYAKNIICCCWDI